MIKQGVMVFLMVTAGVSVSYGAGLPEVHGFVEAAGGARLSHGPDVKHQDLTLLETRAQLKSRYFFEDGYLGEHSGMIDLKAEGVLDGYFDGKTSAQFRELNLALTPFSALDVKAGRQVLTWGTGDYLFINDLFPKDYVSFFSGRDDEYLKKPSDALKMSYYADALNIDAIAIPVFEPNETAEGDRLSFYDSFQGGIAGQASDRFLAEPSHDLSNTEYALRAFRTVGRYEAAGYFFHGFYKNPAAYEDEAARRLFYPRLDVYGASLRGPFATGIANLEVGYYDSRQDSGGDNRLIPNSMVKAMTGYTKDLGNDWRIGFQYLLEKQLHYSAYEENLSAQDLRFDEYRQVLTQRVTKLFKQQTVEVSVFNFYSPSDQDGYLRSSVGYTITDQWKMTLGVNVPWGSDSFTEFGQMQENRNVFLRVRYSF